MSGEDGGEASSFPSCSSPSSLVSSSSLIGVLGRGVVGDGAGSIGRNVREATLMSVVNSSSVSVSELESSVGRYGGEDGSSDASALLSES